MLGIERAAVKVFNGALGVFARDLRHEELEIPLDGCTGLEVRLQNGELTVEGEGDGEVLRGELWVRCTRPWTRSACASLGEATTWKVDREGDRLRLAVRLPSGEVTGLHTDLKLRLPRRLAVGASVSVGAVRVRGLASDVRLGIGVGELDLDLDRGGVGPVHLSSSVGSAALQLTGQRLRGRGLVGQWLRWSGEGAAEVEARCGVGSVRAALA